MITITIRYFASLREQVGRSQETLVLPESLSVLAIWERIHHCPLPDNVLIAINMEYVSPLHSVNEGDELAFFPPVTGG